MPLSGPQIKCRGEESGFGKCPFGIGGWTRLYPIAVHLSPQHRLHTVCVDLRHVRSKH